MLDFVYILLLSIQRQRVAKEPSLQLQVVYGQACSYDKIKLKCKISGYFNRYMSLPADLNTKYQRFFEMALLLLLLSAVYLNSMHMI